MNHIELINVLAIAAALLQLLDGWTTFRGLTSTGAREANPVVARLMDALGIVPGLLLVKLAGVAAVAWAWHYGSSSASP